MTDVVRASLFLRLTHQRLPGVAALALACAGCCTTTGDPSQGGLFCWSRTKAEVRQAGLRKDAEDAQRNADEQATRTAALEKSKADLQSESVARKARLDSLLSENAQLERALAEATRRGTQDEARLAEARSALAANREMLVALKTSPAPTLSGPAADQQVAQFAQQNERLLKLLRLLSER